MKVGMMVPAILQADMRSKNNPFAMWIVGAAYTCKEVLRRIKLSFTRFAFQGRQYFHFDEKKGEGWHYGWKSSRGYAQRNRQHVLRVISQ